MNSPNCVTVLLIEDDPDEAFLFVRAMESLDADWIVCGDAEGALRKLEDGLRPAFAVVDLGLPGMGGLDFIETVRRMSGFSELPMFVLTGSEDPADEERARAAGVSGYLTKPNGFDDFCDALNMVADSPQLRAILHRACA